MTESRPPEPFRPEPDRARPFQPAPYQPGPYRPEPDEPGSWGYREQAQWQPIPGAPPSPPTPAWVRPDPAPPWNQPVPASVPYGYGYPPPVPVRPPPALPDGPREYPQLLRGPRRRWWRPLVALVIAVGIALVAQVVAIAPVALAGAIAGVDRLGSWLTGQLNGVAGGDIQPGGFLYLNLGLIALIPAAGLSTWVAHHIRPGYVSSVKGRFRWRWMLRCAVFIVPLWIVYLGLGFLGGMPAGVRPEHFVLLMIMVVLMTPLQAAGEEYLFRGWILQNVGSWFKRPMVSLVAGSAVSAVAFASAHGSPDPWILGSLGVFAVSAAVITWRTGGLEGAIVIHAVNNIGAFGIVLSFGGWNQAFIGQNTKGSPVQFLIDLAVHTVALALIWWQAKRTKLAWRYEPTGPAVSASPPPPALAGYPAPYPPPGQPPRPGG